MVSGQSGIGAGDDVHQAMHIIVIFQPLTMFRLDVVKLSVNMTLLAGRITLIRPKPMRQKSNSYNASLELEVGKQYAREMRKA